ncbi:MAG: DUF3784 domain-containing protein [Muribaculaceae bacterium]|nr:DUF3784 domain-containing protein [Muribaculaceae bacterium]
MDTMLIVIFALVTLGMVFLAFVILKGWGDGLIAGYNTASKEERQQFNLKRLRTVVAVMILFTTAFVWCAAWIDDIVVVLLGALPVLLIGLVAGIVIANTWCKKK